MKGATSRAERLAGFVNLFSDPGLSNIVRVSIIHNLTLYCHFCRLDHLLIGLDDTGAIHVSVSGSVKSNTSDCCRLRR
jgi:hypothetical protein